MASHPAEGGIGGSAAPRARPAEHRPQGEGPSQVEVGVVLPGEADARPAPGCSPWPPTRRPRRRWPRRRPWPGGPRRRGARARRAPRAASHATPRACSSRTSMSAQRCFTRLELPDGPAELPATGGVGGGGVDAPRRAPAALGRSQHDTELLHRRAVDAGQRRRRRVRPARAGGQRPGGVERVERRRVGIGHRHQAPPLPAADRDRHHDHVGRRAAEDRTGRSRTRRPSLRHRPTPSARRPGRPRPTGLPSPGRPAPRAAPPSGPSPATSTAAAQAVGSIGPGATARPSSSSTTASSMVPKPSPPSASATARPSHPSFASSAQKGGRPPVPSSIAALATAGEHRSAVKRRTVSSRARWSGPMAMLTSCPLRQPV